MGENMAVIAASNPDRFGIIMFIIAVIILLYSFLSTILAFNRKRNLMKIAAMIEMAHNGQKITKEMYYDKD